MAEPFPIERIASRAAFAARQGARVAWFIGHGMVMRRLRKSAGSGKAPPKTDYPVPSDRRILADMRRLFERDLANAEAGLYPLPRDRDGPLMQQLARTRAFFADLPRVHARREENRHHEVLNETNRGKRPRYYLQNFHFQSGGWLSEESARLYDLQVEVLFKGSGNAMRRQLLVPLAEFVRGRDQRKMRLVDLGCGTGRFLDSVAEAFPRLGLVGIDLSGSYINEARRHLKRRPRVGLAVAKAEELPLAGESVDGFTAVFLFHELPPKVRLAVAGEIFRVLRPGGRFLLLDSLQIGDIPDYDGLLDVFPQSFHEPYYAGYVRADLAKLFAKAGLVRIKDEPVFMSKISAFEKSA
ncbi:MAG: class I SAM-dependent methyltransferase [Hyphomicrobiales bacterium]|nr:class I SAM-dependent methyltransferase [Hyphomicrobiales bacterium]